MIIIWQKKKLKFLRMFCHVKRKLNVAKKIQNRKKNVSKAFGELVKNMPILKKNLTQHMWVCHRDCRFLNFDDQRILLSFYIQVHSPLQIFSLIFQILQLYIYNKHSPFFQENLLPMLSGTATTGFIRRPRQNRTMASTS